MTDDTYKHHPHYKEQWPLIQATFPQLVDLGRSLVPVHRGIVLVIPGHRPPRALSTHEAVLQPWPTRDIFQEIVLQVAAYDPTREVVIVTVMPTAIICGTYTFNGELVVSRFPRTSV